VSRGDVGGDREAVSSTAPPASRAGDEFADRCRQPWPTVGHGDLEAASAPVAVEGYRTLAVLDRVGNEIPGRLSQAGAIALEDSWSAPPVKRQLDPAGVREWPECRHRIREQGRDVDGVDTPCASSSGGGSAQVIERGAHAGELEVDRPQRLRRGSRVAGQHLQPKSGHGDRSAQLVACAGDELHAPREHAPEPEEPGTDRDRDDPPAGGDQHLQLLQLAVSQAVSVVCRSHC
jgi:hypothetical protein